MARATQQRRQPRKATTAKRRTAPASFAAGAIVQPLAADPSMGAKQYIKDVLSAGIVVGKLVRLAVERHVRDLETADARGLWFDENAAAHAIRLFSFLRHSKGKEFAGKPFVLSPWQSFILWVVFGWRHKVNGSRRFRMAYQEVARKNGKSTFAAGVGLKLFFADGEPGAEVYTAATKREQARIVHLEAVRMVKSSPPLKKRIGIFKDNLHVEATNSKFEPLSADGDTMDGLNVHGAIVDELHQHKTREVWDALDTATGARTQPLIFAITTAGFNRNSVCWSVREYAVKVLTGIFEDDSFFAFVATLDEGDDWTDPAVYAKANPNLGVSVQLDELIQKAKTAEVMVSAQNAFKTKRLNIWTDSAKAWLRMERWDAPANSAPLVKGELDGLECYGGLDLSSTTDITAFVLWFPSISAVLAWFWIPQINAEERSKRDKVPYVQWCEQGIVEMTDGDAVDYDVIRNRINEIGKLYAIKEIAVDRWNSTQITNQLQGDGFTMVPFGQGFRDMNAPTKELEKLVIQGKCRHGGNPAMRWMASNGMVQTDAAGNVKPAKDKSSEKIDGIVALIMAIGRAIVTPADGVENWDGKIQYL